MRKLIIAATALFLLALVSTSCKVHESCPAYGGYGSVDSEQTEKLPS